MNRPNANRYTPLMEAIKTGHADCVELLLDAGADVNNRDFEGYLPLIRATIEGNVQSVAAIINAGADVNTTSRPGGYTSLMHAAKKGHYLCIEILIESGANVNMVNRNGCTALMYAVRVNDIRCVNPLLKAGADVNLIDRRGVNVLRPYIPLTMEMGRLFLAAGLIDKLPETFTTHAPSSTATSEVKYDKDDFESGNLSLMSMCRKRVREQLIFNNLRSNLFVKVPQLGLPSTVSSYLLFNITLP